MNTHKDAQLYKVTIVYALAVIVALLTSSCTPSANTQSEPATQSTSPQQPPKTNATPTETPKGTPAIVIAPPVKKTDPLEMVKQAAATSSCSSYSWKDRGPGPLSYFKGMALVYAKALCNQSAAHVQITATTPIATNKTKDVLSYYGVKTNPLRMTYVALIGLGMRESSGKYCSGRDMTAAYNSADTAESGLFQTSWGARVVSSTLPTLFKKYQASSSECMLDVFSSGVSCDKTSAKNWGSGDGYTWQKLTKECPAFAAEFASVVVRKNGGSAGEFGPIRRKEMEIYAGCTTLLTQVEKIVTENPTICSSLKQ